MKYKHIALFALIAALVALASVVMAAQQDRFTLKAPSGISFSEFKGYDAWQMVGSSLADGGDGCGTSKEGCIKSILANPAMIRAYNEGFPTNGKPVPDGAAVVKIEWLKVRDTRAPYAVTIPGNHTEVAFMLKDSKRFADTNGWGYATFQYDAATETYKPKPGDANFGRTNCHGCHTAGAKTTDFVYTRFAKR